LPAAAFAQRILPLKISHISAASSLFLIRSLQSRQKRWQREDRERIRNMPDPTVPEGHTVLPDQERRETLATLKNSKLLQASVEVNT